jgi:hypothetical protein
MEIAAEAAGVLEQGFQLRREECLVQTMAMLASENPVSCDLIPKPTFN